MQTEIKQQFGRLPEKPRLIQAGCPLYICMRNYNNDKDGAWRIYIDNYYFMVRLRTKRAQLNLRTLIAACGLKLEIRPT